jgi:CubicO group peptidase (beta-lactamase class C family)
MHNRVQLKAKIWSLALYFFSGAAIIWTEGCSLPHTRRALDFSNLERSASTELAKLNIPGASIAIVQGDKIVYSNAFGKANIETGEPARAEMLFRLGSTTKMFTAAALTGLAAEGKIDLNSPVGNYLQILPPKIASVTASQLLSHTAGICDVARIYGSHDDSGLGNGIRTWTDNWMVLQPGTTFSYSSPGYWLAGYLIETLSSMPYADAMEARLFRPIGMERTTFRPTMAMTWPLAQGHEFVNGKLRIARPAADSSETWPSGSMFSNSHDLARFVIAFMNGGRLEGKQVLDPRVIALMSVPYVTMPGGEEGYQHYCYGLGRGEHRGFTFLQHDGARIGYGSDIRMIPEQRVAVIILTNLTDGSLPETAEKALEIGVPLKPKTTMVAGKSAVPISAEDIARVAGIYRNGDRRIEIVARDNRLFVKDSAHPETELTKRSEKSFAVGSTGITILAGTGSRSEYVHLAGRAFSRVQ